MEVVMPMVAIVAAIITFAVYIVDYKTDGAKRNK
jgi:hypothetical protein